MFGVLGQQMTEQFDGLHKFVLLVSCLTPFQQFILPQPEVSAINDLHFAHATDLEL